MSEQSAEMLTVAEAAKRCGMSRTWLYEVMDAGRLTYVRFGRARRIPKTSLLKLIEECTVAARTSEG